MNIHTIINSNLKEIKEKSLKEQSILCEIDSMIHKKENFSKIWLFLLENDIEDLDIYKGVIFDFFGLDADVREVNMQEPNSLCWFWNDYTILLPFGDKNNLSKKQFINYKDKFIVKIKYPYKIREFLRHDRSFMHLWKDEGYVFAKKYLDLLNKGDVFSFLYACYFSFMKGKIYNRKDFRNKAFCENYVKKYEEKIKEEIGYYEKTLLSGEEEFKIFKNKVEPQLNKIFKSEFCKIIYVKEDCFSQVKYEGV